MALSVKNSNDPFIRVRLVRFSDGTQIQPLQILKLRVDTFDFQQSNFSIDYFYLFFHLKLQNSINKSTKISRI